MAIYLLQVDQNDYQSIQPVWVWSVVCEFQLSDWTQQAHSTMTVCGLWYNKQG